MATKAHCAFCFDTLNAHFAKGSSSSLTQVEEAWDEYTRSTSLAQSDNELTGIEHAPSSKLQSPTVERVLKTSSSSAASSNSSLPSSISSSSAQSSVTTPASSSAETSLARTRLSGKYPLFVTWNTHRAGHKSLRGCIGTFEAQDLEDGLSSYALTSALEDVRFQPIPKSQLPSLSNDVTLLTNFSQPIGDPMDWVLGLHGIRIRFAYHGRHYGATYLPSVAPEQGWTKEETIISLMRKSGWNGNSGSWQRVWKDGKGELVTYEGSKAEMDYSEWRAWRDWMDAR